MTKKKLFYLILIVLFPLITSAQDTFSIIAVDTITDEIGGAGASCIDESSIQGNILLGQQILDSMEARFLNTTGTLAEKMMAALQGAKVPGANTRCLDEGTSSLSAFIRVAQPDNTPGNFWCDLLVPSVPYGVEPIDSLQVLFDEWLIWTSVKGEKFVQPNRAYLFPTPANSEIRFEIPKIADIQQLSLQLLSMNGELMTEIHYKDQPVIVNTSGYSSGVYLYKVFGDNQLLDAGKFSISK